MSPMEKCLAVLAALATADARGSVEVASAEIEIFLQTVEPGADRKARALDRLVERLNAMAPATATTGAIEGEINRRIDALSASPVKPDPS